MKRFLLLATLCVGASYASAQDVIPNLGQAELYSVFGIGNTQMTMSSGNTVVTGNVGVGPNSSLDFSGGGHINGNLNVDPTSKVNITGGSMATTQSANSLVAAEQGAVMGSMTAANDAATQTLSSITNKSTTLSATGAVSVFDVTGDVNLQGGSTLTLNGSANDYVILNVDGAMTLGGGSQMQLTGGLTANHVLINMVGSGGDVNFNGNSTVDGTVLAVNRNITVSGGIVNGAVIGSENGQLKLQSGPKINGQPTPEPISMLVLAPGLLLLRKRKSSK